MAEAQRRLAAETDEELARLTALQAVNPTVRDTEIQALRAQREQGLAMDAEARQNSFHDMMEIALETALQLD